LDDEKTVSRWDKGIYSEKRKNEQESDRSYFVHKEPDKRLFGSVFMPLKIVVSFL